MSINRVLVIVFILFSFILVSIRGGNLSYAMLYVSILLPLFCYLYTVYVHLRLKIYEGVATHKVTKGELNPYTFTLANEDIIAFSSVRVHFRKDKSTILEGKELEEYYLIPGDVKSKETHLRCKYRGIYEVGVDSVEIKDFLQLFSINYKVSSNLNLTVLPRVIPLEDSRLIMNNPDIKYILQPNVSENTILDVDTRPYTNGDTKKQIHWKASSKENRLLSRKILTEPKNRIRIYMNLMFLKEETSRYMYEDQVIELAISFAHYGVNHEVPIYFTYDYMGVKEYKIDRKESFDEFYQSCISLNFRSSIPMDELIQLDKMNQVTSNIIITNEITTELIVSLSKLQLFGENVAVIVLEVENEVNMENRKALYDMGIDCTIITRHELEEEAYDFET